jgi:hypothetical protein
VHDREDQREAGADLGCLAAGQGGADSGDASRVNQGDGQAGGQRLDGYRRSGGEAGQAGQAGQQPDGVQRGGNRRGEVAEAGCLGVLAHHHPAPAAVVEVLRAEPSDVFAGAVGDLQLGGEPDQAAAGPDPVVQLPVLGAEHLLVPPAGLLDRLPAVDAEVDAVRGAGHAAGVPAGRADAGLGGHAPRHGLLERGLARRGHDPADVGRAGLGQDRDRGLDVVGREQGVPVDADDDLVPRGAQGQVEGGRDLAGGIGDHRDARIAVLQVAGDLLGPVGGGTDGEDELHRAGVVLAEDVPDGLGQVPFLVPDRHHDGHGWVFHDAVEGTAARGP